MDLKTYITLIILLLYSILIIDAKNVLIKGTNFKCKDEGSLIELPAHLRKPCILCTCRNNLVVCEQLKTCKNLKDTLERRRKTIRCIEEECCSEDYDLYENNLDGDKSIKYETSNKTSKSIDIYNEVKISSIRYLKCSENLEEKNLLEKKNILTFLHNQLKPTLNTRSVTTESSIKQQKKTPQPVEQNGLCTLSYSFNTDLIKNRQHLTTFDGLRMRFRNEENCHYILAQDCLKKSFSVQLLNTPYEVNFNQTSNKSNKSSILEGKTTSNYTEKYISAFKKNKKKAKGFYSLYIRIGNKKIQIDSMLNVKINRRLVSLPFYLNDVVIRSFKNYLLVNLEKDLKIIWSGKEIIISLPAKYQKQTCGLCGNFNYQIEDELINKNGHILQSQLRFFQTWSVSRIRKFFDLDD